MEAMQQLSAPEVDGGAEEVIRRDLEEELEETAEEPLLKRRSNTRSDESDVIDPSETTSSSDAGDAPPELVTVDEAAHEEAGDPVQKIGGSEINWSQFNIKREDLAAKFKDADIEELMSAAINGRQIEGKHIEYREGTFSEELAVKEGEEVVYEMEESDEEVVELEFETAVQKMHTHDGYGMYCPNCSNQITKVVLRRKIRKRKVLVAADNERQNLVGCLSCLSIFIPSGNKLNPFRIFAGGNRDNNLQLREQPPTPEPTQTTGNGLDPFWFWKKRRVDANALKTPLLSAEEATSATAASELGDEAIQQGNQSIQVPEELPVSDVTMAATDSPQAKGKGFGLFGFFRKRRDEEVTLTLPLLSAAAQIQSSSTAFTSTAVGILQSSSIAVSSKPRDEAIEQGDGAVQVEEDEKSDSFESLANESVTNSVADTEQEQTVGMSEGIASIAAFGSVSQSSPPRGSVLHRNVVIDVHEKHGNATSKTSESNLFNEKNKGLWFEELVQGAISPAQPQLKVTRDFQPSDVRIPMVETPVVIGATRPDIVTVRGPSWSMDILKSIVYGGLMESITSLIVVSLATSLDVTTRNVVAIGLAFLVGGFILLLHHLRALRYGDSSEQRYNEQLGRQARFPLHTFVAVVSYIVCGLMPPLVYNFTFRETDDREFKMVAVAAASLVCIFALAIAQAYVRGERRFMAYFKTVVYYVVVAAIASGAAFGIGYLVKDPFPCPAVLVNSV